MIHYGMASSVKVPAAMVPTLLHAWFSDQLSAPTTDMIEIRICANESYDNEDTPIKLLELYVSV